MSVTVFQATRRIVLEQFNLYWYRCENLRSHKRRHSYICAQIRTNFWQRIISNSAIKAVERFVTDAESRSVGAVTAASIVRHCVIANFVERMMTEESALVCFSTTAGHFAKDPEIILRCRDLNYASPR
jgi:hypothetical protein